MATPGINYTRLRLATLDYFGTMAQVYEWGSNAQIAAENKFYKRSSEWFNIDWDEHPYLLKATTEEAMDYAMNIIKKKIQNEN